MLKAALNSGSDSTAYGLPNLIRSKHTFQKIMWLIFLALATSASVWYTVNLITNYLEYEVVTVISDVYEQPIRFPTISFCSYYGNSFANKRLSQFITDLTVGYNRSLISGLENYFEPFFTRDYSLCYRFNSGKNLEH